MNYDEVAKKLLDDVCWYLQCDHCFHVGGWQETRGETCPNNAVGTIAAALRRAANEAAWDGYDCGFGVCEDIERCGGATAKRLDAEMFAKYGPQPTPGEPR